MSTTGSLDVNLDNYSTMVNESSRFGAGITTGIADQGELIGSVFGIVMAVGALLVLIGVALGIILYVIMKAKSVTGSVKKI
jgi:hypothetical protein